MPCTIFSLVGAIYSSFSFTENHSFIPKWIIVDCVRGERSFRGLFHRLASKQGFIEVRCPSTCRLSISGGPVQEIYVLRFYLFQLISVFAEVRHTEELLPAAG